VYVHVVFVFLSSVSLSPSHGFRSGMNEDKSGIAPGTYVDRGVSCVRRWSPNCHRTINSRTPESSDVPISEQSEQSEQSEHESEQSEQGEQSEHMF
jgi:hypothetical protein